MTIRTLTWFYRAMAALSELELAIAEASTTNFNYLMNCRDRARHWQKELKLFELRSQS